MSLLAGYLGQSDPRIDAALAGALAHRRTGPVHVAATSHGRLLWAADAFTSPEAEHGLAREGDCALAVAGERVPSPAELLARYRARGAAAFEGMPGAYVLAILDGDSLLLARDIAGIRSLYVTRHEGRRLFAIEPKALWQLPGFRREIEPEAVARYFTFSFQPARSTMLRGIEQLPAARALRYAGDGPPSRHRLYHHAERAQAATEAPGEPPLERFRTELVAAVRAGLDGQRPVAATLSGGLDSSLVAALVTRELGRPLTTYSLHFGKDMPNELEYARLHARHIGSDHHEVELAPRKIVAQLSELVMLMDDPIGDPVTLGNYALARRIGRDHPVVFNGEGGDPCFGGPKTIPMMMHHWYGTPDREAGWRERAYLQSYRRAYEELPRLIREPYRAAAEHMPALLSPYFEREHGVLLRSLLEINMRLKGAYLILPKVERLQRSAGILPHSPLFAPAMVDAAMTLPTRFILHAGTDKVILRQLAQGLVPDAIIRRPKSGMRVPVQHWFQGELRKLAKKLLHPRRLERAGVLVPKRVTDILRFDTEEASARYGIWLWMLLTFEMWRSLVIDGTCDW